MALNDNMSWLCKKIFSATSQNSHSFYKIDSDCKPSFNTVKPEQSKSKGSENKRKRRKKLLEKKPENYYLFQSTQFKTYESHKPMPMFYCDLQTGVQSFYTVDWDCKFWVSIWNDYCLFSYAWLRTHNLESVCSVERLGSSLESSRDHSK